jgi:hypothetical protein
MRLFWLIGSLAAALAIGVLTLQVPRPVAADAPATAFSTGRAMADVREIAQRPHPIGSPDHARVQAYLLQRMAALGLQTSTQAGPISPGSVRRLTRQGGDPAAADFSAVNLIGVLPGRNPALPATTPCPTRRARRTTPRAWRRCWRRCGRSARAVRPSARWSCC